MDDRVIFHFSYALTREIVLSLHIYEDSVVNTTEIDFKGY